MEKEFIRCSVAEDCRQAGQASWAVRPWERVVRLDAAIFTQLMLRWIGLHSSDEIWLTMASYRGTDACLDFIFTRLPVLSYPLHLKLDPNQLGNGVDKRTAFGTPPLHMVEVSVFRHQCWSKREEAIQLFFYCTFNILKCIYFICLCIPTHFLYTENKKSLIWVHHQLWTMFYCLNQRE